MEINTGKVRKFSVRKSGSHVIKSFCALLFNLKILFFYLEFSEGWIRIEIRKWISQNFKKV